MSASHHAEIFLQARRGVGHYSVKTHHANNKRYIFYDGYREVPALPATPGDGALTSTDEPNALIFQSHDQKKG